jgi:SNF2 family DNA or RNA helicase
MPRRKLAPNEASSNPASQKNETNNNQEVDSESEVSVKSDSSDDKDYRPSTSNSKYKRRRYYHNPEMTMDMDDDDNDAYVNNHMEIFFEMERQQQSRREMEGGVNLDLAATNLIQQNQNDKHQMVFIEPTEYIYYDTKAISMEVIGQVVPSVELAKQRPGVQKTNYSSRTYHNAYKNRVVKTELAGRKGEESFMFYVGEYSMNLHVPKDEFDQKFFEHKSVLNEYDLFFYEAFIHWTESYINYKSKLDQILNIKEAIKTSRFSIDHKENKNWYTDLSSESKLFYLFAASKNELNKPSLFLRVDKNDRNTSLITLIEKKRIYLVFKSLTRLDQNNETENQNEIQLALKCEIYMNDSNQHEYFYIDPSERIPALDSPHMHFLLAHFYFNQLYPNKSRSKQLCLSENQSYDDNLNNDVSMIEKDMPDNYKNENLFDLIYELRKNERANFQELESSDPKSNSIIQVKSCLKPNLRPYQVRAIKWMMSRENMGFNEQNSKKSMDQNVELHPMYAKITNTRGQTIFYHKFHGMFCTEAMPLRKQSLSGGILADEMGLGKTLEVLALILINQRQNIDPSFDIKPDQKKINANKTTFSCICGDTPVAFRQKGCEYEPHKPGFKEPTYYSCVQCGVSSHVRCLNYQDSPETFLCLTCCTNMNPIKSGCTLVVTPATISHQWAQEIEKHINKKLKVFVYNGVQQNHNQHYYLNQKPNVFIQPRDLAKYDIVITTYEVLNNELKHVFAFENMKILRKAKRFMNIPCPLINVEWWRICLDEVIYQ